MSRMSIKSLGIEILVQQKNYIFLDQHSTPKLKIEKLYFLVFNLYFWQFCTVFDCPNNLLYEKVTICEPMSRIFE